MKNWYKYLVGAIFLVMIFALTAVNLYETAGEMLNSDEKPSAAEIREGLESVETIKYKAININGVWQRVSGHRCAYDMVRDRDLMRIEDDYIVAVHPDIHSDEEFEVSADKLAEVKEYLESRGAHLLYVQNRGKGAAVDEKYYINDELACCNERIDHFMEILEDRGIDHIDGQDVIGDQGISAYFKTDHHWTIESALKVSEAVCRRLEENGLDLDENRYAESSYKKVMHREAFLGAEGRRIGRFFCGLDDIAEITPDYPTDFTVSVPKKDLVREGSFENSIMDSGKDIDHYSFTDSAYYMYWGGDYPLTEVVNHTSENDYDVMVVKDSFGIPVSAFMANAFSRMQVVDLRYYKGGNLKQLIDKYDPDAVVFVYGNGYIGKEKMFRLHK